MPLPEKVIEQLGQESPSTPGWAFGATLFSGGLFFVVIIIYLGLTYGYEPYLNGQVSQIQNQITQLGNSISPTDQTNIINFYSQTSNLQTLLQAHILTSQFFSWLEKNTEQNVYYTNFALTSGDQVTLSVNAASEADVNQQIAIFENSPQIKSVAISGVAQVQAGQGFSFNATLIMDPSLFIASTQ